MAHERVKALVAIVLLVTVFATVIGVDAWRGEPVPQETIHGIAEALFDTYVVAFMVLSVLLTGALFGALYMGMRPGLDEEDEEVEA